MFRMLHVKGDPQALRRTSASVVCAKGRAVEAQL